MIENLKVRYPFEEDKCTGDIMTLNDFLSTCKTGGFVNDDGYTVELVNKGQVIYDEALSPSQYRENEADFVQYQVENGLVRVVWYNR